MRFYYMTLLLLPMLLFIVSCGVDTIEESDANILDPVEDFRFQNLPILDNGSLITIEKVPVITIEKTTREDDNFHYWQLKADPAPTRADLVVGVEVGSKYRRWLRDNYHYFHNTLYVPILKFEETSTEIPVPIWFSIDLAVTHPWVMIGRMHEEWANLLDDMIPQRQAGLTSADLPPFQVFNGYVIPQGFQFTYHSVGESSSLDLQRPE